MQGKMPAFRPAAAMKRCPACLAAVRRSRKYELQKEHGRQRAKHPRDMEHKVMYALCWKAHWCKLACLYNIYQREHHSIHSLFTPSPPAVAADLGTLRHAPVQAFGCIRYVPCTQRAPAIDGGPCHLYLSSPAKAAGLRITSPGSKLSQVRCERWKGQHWGWGAVR